jgi:hypothetical protein
MADQALAAPPSAPLQANPRRRWRPWLIGSAVAFAVIAGVAFYFISANWPYRYRKIKPLIEDVFGSQITVVRYHRTYFPHPGFMASGLTLRRKSAPNQPPIGSIDSVYVQGRWSDLLLLRERVQRVSMTGVHLVLPPPGSRASQEDFPPGSSMDFVGPDTFIAQLDVHDSALDVLRANGSRFSFPIRLLNVENFQKGRTMRFAVDMENAVPSGRVSASGSFGPLNGQQLGATPVQGKFTFNEVNLHDVGNIRGTLSSSGHFSGRLDALEADATSRTPDFAVDDGKATQVDGSIRCTVNSLNGNVNFHSIDASIGKTQIHATGAVVGPPKTTDLDISVVSGRAEDLLRPFLKDEPPIAGQVSLHSHAYIGPSGEGIGFLDRLRVNGAVDVPAERVTNKATEKSLADFSERAQGGKAPQQANSGAPASATADGISSLEGPAIIRNGIVSTQGLKFQIAGARAELAGTFNLHTSAAHMAGNLIMESDISHATTGFKSMLLKPLAPFFKKKSAGAVIPIAIVGTPGHYQVTQDLTHSK